MRMVQDNKNTEITGLGNSFAHLGHLLITRDVIPLNFFLQETGIAKEGKTEVQRSTQPASIAQYLS